MGPDGVCAALGANVHQGLSQKEAEKRLQEFSSNELKKTGGITWFGMLMAQFQNVLIIILLIAVGLSALLGERLDAIAIAVIVLFAVLLGFIQEYRAERAMEALQKMAAPTATVLRDGAEKEVAARDLVPGDIILIATGDKIPADGRLLEAVNLRVAEASLTGESAPVHKGTDPLPDATLGIGDRKNMVYMGTNATYGRGKAVVIATGMQTEFGKIATMLQSVSEPRTPLQKNLDRVGNILARAALAIVAIIVGAGFLRGQPFLEILIFGVALAVAVVPEALPAVVTISLAIGVQRMVKRHALIRRLPAVETLGSTSVICSDKTGTLTRDEMTVRKIVVNGTAIDVTGAGYEPKGEFILEGKERVTLSLSNGSTCDNLRELLTAATLCNDAHLVQENGAWSIRGDPTEGGLVVAAAKAGIMKEEVEKRYPRVDEVPFSSETKRMTTVHTVDDKRMAYAKGAPEIILDACTIDAVEKERFLKEAKMLAAQALRVLGVAKKELGAAHTPLPLRKGGGVGGEGVLAAAGEGSLDPERGMTFLGLVGMIDPPRVEAKEAVAKCGHAGIRVIMVTGDHPLTAEAIARELGILQPGGRVLTGKEID
ncbi:HAD-IC family P-type ATPase, partial [Candidatus Peregrinibacteria bacterium]|nr:HAD-IC family P-type ATPase [Candidatus Peregrinibacteria bacterium]